LYDPDPNTVKDKSLRAFINHASSGRADLDVIVWDTQTIDQQDVPPDALELKLGPTLRGDPYHCDAAAIVMLGGPGAQRWARTHFIDVGSGSENGLYGLSSIVSGNRFPRREARYG
jgi:hypothetical protein